MIGLKPIYLFQVERLDASNNRYDLKYQKKLAPDFTFAHFFN